VRNLIFISSLLIAGLFSSVILGQKASSAPTPGPPQVELPKGNGAWALRVVRTGGFTGDSFMDITIISTGHVIFDSGQGQRESTLSPDVLKMLGPAVLSAKFPQIPNPGNDSGGCYDCYTTVMTVRRREPKGKERTYSATWVPTTVGSVPEDFVSISRLALGLSN